MRYDTVSSYPCSGGQGKRINITTFEGHDHARQRKGAGTEEIVVGPAPDVMYAGPGDLTGRGR